MCEAAPCNAARRIRKNPVVIDGFDATVKQASDGDAGLKNIIDHGLDL